MKESTPPPVTAAQFSSGQRLLDFCAPRVQRCTNQPVGSRLNVILPFISEHWTFGGIATALRLFERLATEFDTCRIIVMYENQSQVDASRWPGWVQDLGDVAPRSLAYLAHKNASLAICEQDFFLATFWSTAVCARLLVAEQARLFAQRRRRFVYLLQDYEPGFYPASANSVVAESTYDDRDGTIAVFNSRPLAEYFWETGRSYLQQYLYEPMLNPTLRMSHRQLGECRKERLILIYGRPSHPRNGFDILTAALEVWTATYPAATEWSLVSWGEQHDEITLGRGVSLRSRGKFTLEEYADHLSRCWIGISFVFSPHPGYTVLEMAQFGAWVITNRFANKDPTQLAPNLIGVHELTAANIAAAISNCCSRYRDGKTAALANLPPMMRSDGEEFPFAHSLVREWQRDTRSGP
jgi:O-antigen biosynthesis protein